MTLHGLWNIVLSQNDKLCYKSTSGHLCCVLLSIISVFHSHTQRDIRCLFLILTIFLLCIENGCFERTTATPAQNKEKIVICCVIVVETISHKILMVFLLLLLLFFVRRRLFHYIWIIFFAIAIAIDARWMQVRRNRNFLSHSCMKLCMCQRATGNG